MKNRRRELGDAGPVVADGARWWIDEIAPAGDVLYDIQEMEDLEGFERGAFDAGFVEQDGGIEEPIEGEASAAGEHDSYLGGALLLQLDPADVGGRFKGENPSAAEGRGCAACDVVAEAWPLKRRGAGFCKRRRDGRQ